MSRRHTCCLLIFCILYETEKTGITDHSDHIHHDSAAVHEYSDSDSSELREVDIGIYGRQYRTARHPAGCGG